MMQHTEPQNNPTVTLQTTTVHEALEGVTKNTEQLAVALRGLQHDLIQVQAELTKAQSHKQALEQYAQACPEEVPKPEITPRKKHGRLDSQLQ